MPIMRRPGRSQPAGPDRPADDAQVTDLVRALSAPAPTEDRARRARLIGQLGKALGASARVAGTGAVLSGQWLSDLVEQMAPHVTVRDLQTLQDTYQLEGNALAEAVIRSASRSTAALGAAAGALAAAELAAPPALLATPVQLAAETLAVVAVELRMLGELHEIYGAPVAGTTTAKATELLTTWVRRRALEGSAGGLLLGAAARRELRKRVMKRLGTSVTTLAPFLAGAVAGAEVNRRETRKLGDAVAKDLSVRALRTFPADRLIEGQATEGRPGPSGSPA